MSIKATFPSGTNNITVSGLYQWDYGQILEIEAPDIGTEVMEVHFACTNMSEAIVRSCSFSNGVGTVTIPDRCLEQASTITAWVYRIVGTQGHTEKVIQLTVTARTRPSVVREDIPEEITDKYTELITEVNEAVENLESGSVTVALAKNATTAGYAGSAGNAASATYATSAGRADNATNADNATAADKAIKDSEGNRIYDSYIRWEDHPLGGIATTQTISNGFNNKVRIGVLSDGQCLDQIVTLSVSIARKDSENEPMERTSFVGHKTYSSLMDGDGNESVDFYCPIQGPYIFGQYFVVGHMRMKLHCIDKELWLEFVEGEYTRFAYTTPAGENVPSEISVVETYDVKFDHRYGHVRYWFA